MTTPTDAAIAQAFREVYSDVSEFLPVSEFYGYVLARAAIAAMRAEPPGQPLAP